MRRLKDLVSSSLPRFLILLPLVAQPTLCLPGSAGSRVSPDSWIAHKACELSSEFSTGRESEARCSALNALLARARRRIVRATSPAETLSSLNDFFFNSEGFHPTSDLGTADHLLLDGVIAGKKGHCVGLATVYLILAEELGLPIHAVATPKHIFLRWDDGEFRRNIELFRKGREVTDESYIRQQGIPQESIRRRVFLANLSRREFLGFIYQNLGVLESQKGDLEASRRLYAKALHLDAKLEAAYYNRGNDELKQGQFKMAIRDYTRALKLYPTDIEALKNRALAWKGIGENDEAEEDWKRASEIEPISRAPQ